MTMSGNAPIFIDQFGTGGGPSGGKDPDWSFDEGPVWALAWQGKVPLWKIFWVYFVMGHGVILGLGCGVLIFSLLAGFFVNPTSAASGAAGLGVGATLVVSAFLVFAIWAVVAVWQCANNCIIKARGIYARVLMVGYVITLALPVINYAIG